VKEVVEEALELMAKNGLDALGNFEGHPGELSLARAQEVAAAINRIRQVEARPEAG
jgi:hypothetical protein